MLRCDVQAQGQHLHRCTPEEFVHAFVDPVVVLLFTTEDPDQRLLVELTPQLAAYAIDRVLGGDGSGPAPGITLSDGEKGVLAYLVADALPKDSGWLLTDVLTTKASAIRLLQGKAATVWGTHLVIGACEGIARVWIADPLRRAQTRLPSPHLYVAMCIDVAEAVLLLRDLDGIRPGDVLLLDEDDRWPNRRLRAVGGRRRTWWLHPENHQIVRVEDQEEQTIATVADVRAPAPQENQDSPMSEPKTDATRLGRPSHEALAAVGDAPVHISVEVARLSMSLEEVARLSEGEVVRSSAAIGDEVALRVGSEIIATGELVDIEGQLGVRIRRLK